MRKLRAAIQPFSGEVLLREQEFFTLDQFFYPWSNGRFMSFRYFWLVVFWLSVSGCSEAPTVEYVFPNGFKGIVKIRAMQTNGVAIKATNDVIRLVFPESGILDIRSRIPSEQWHIPTAKFRSGKPIAVVTDGAGNPSEVALRSVGRIDDKEEWFVIGTFADLDAAIEKKDGFKWPAN